MNAADRAATYAANAANAAYVAITDLPAYSAYAAYVAAARAADAANAANTDAYCVETVAAIFLLTHPHIGVHSTATPAAPADLPSTNRNQV